MGEQPDHDTFVAEPWPGRTLAQNPMRVLAAVIERDGRLLVAQRPLHKRHGGLWEFPGGKMEPGETHLEAAARELKEELSLVVKGAGAILFSHGDPGSDFIIDFVAVEADGDPLPNEHLAVRWVDPLGLRDLQMAPADAKFAPLLWEDGRR